MSIAFTCIFIAFLLNYLPKVPTAYAMYKLDNRYDNSYPRDQQARLTGFGKRALSAHLNSFEVFPGFAAAVIVSHLTGGNPATADNLSIAFVVSRVVYIGLYLANYHFLRSTAWTVGVICIALLFFHSVWGF